MMKVAFSIGQVLVDHTVDSMQVLRILHFSQDEVWLGDISFAISALKKPKQDTGKFSNRGHVRQPFATGRAEFERKLTVGTHSVVNFEIPEHWRISSMGATSDWSPSQHQRRNLAKWKAKQAALVDLISPLLKEHPSIGHILELGLYKSWPLTRARELQISSPRRVYDALNRFLIGLGTHALIPGYVYSGAPGVQRFNTKRSGRRNTAELDKRIPASLEYSTSESDRFKLAKGYRRHKQRGVSLQVAYLRTLNEYFVSSIGYDSSGQPQVVLLEKYPTLDQFIYWGKRPEGNLSPRSINAGQSKEKNRNELRAGREHSSIFTVGTVGEIDSTSTDQNLVSEASTLKILRAPTRTVLVDLCCGYVSGLYVGFESSSTWTSLMAILNAAESKVEFCARFGIHINEDDWLSIVPREFSADNGEMKSFAGMDGIEAIEASLVFTQSYLGEAKPAVESQHRSTHATLDHLMPGSTQGRQRQRGESNPALEGCMTFHDYMRNLIKHYLWKNNDEYYPVPTIEMRRDGVRPNRKSIMLWCIEKGYVSSMPVVPDLLRPRCLPKFKAVIGPQGIELLDPTCASEKLIKGLLFHSQELRELGLCGPKRKRCTVQLDPTDLSHVYVNSKKMLKVPLDSNDPHLSTLTLFDWLTIQLDDELTGYLYRKNDIARRATNIAAMDRQHRDAKRKKKSEVQSLSHRPSKKSMTANRGENTLEEMRSLAQSTLKIPTQKPQAVTSSITARNLATEVTVNPYSSFLSKRRSLNS